MSNNTNKDKLVLKNPLAKDVLEINSILHISWLNTYPNKNLNITKEDINLRFKSLSDEDRKTQEDRYRNTPDNRKFKLLTLNNKKIGFMSLSINEDNSGKIQAIYLLPEYQSKGFGSMMMNYALKWLKECKNITIDCAEYNTKALNFYKKFGFEITEKVESYKIPNNKEIPIVRLVLNKQNILK